MTQNNNRRVINIFKNNQTVLKQKVANGLKHGLQITVLLIIPLSLFSQTYRITGKVTDKRDRAPVAGAYVFVTAVNDSSIRQKGITSEAGRFDFYNLSARPYKVTIKCVGYQQRSFNIELSGSETDLGQISMELDTKVLDEVIIMARGTAIQRGDTTIMSADAYKVNPDATVEDLIKKMPGITMENGVVKAQGEEVKKVLVDGRQFFGDDPSVALKNLPAYVIDKVQVYNKLSDQAELTGFDDGQSSKTINLVTRREYRAGQFGKISGGTDFQDKYMLGGNINFFHGARRISVNGSLNNINQQNFAMQNMTSREGKSGMNNPGVSYGGMSGGIAKTTSFGTNYSDTWGKKINVNGSYFFNTTVNDLQKETNTEYLYIEDGKYATSSTNSTTRNYNHRLNLRIDYSIDSLNSIVFTPRLSLQNNDEQSYSEVYTTGGSVNTLATNSSEATTNALSFSSDLTWRHKFTKPRRTFSTGISLSDNENLNKDKQWAITDSIPDHQYSDGSTGSYSLAANMIYTEPVGVNAMIQVNYNVSYSYNNTDKYTYAMGDDTEIMNQIDSLSSVYTNDYITNKAGISYLYRKSNLLASVGIDYQRADLTGELEFPQNFEVTKTFANVLPSFMLNYKINSTANVRFSYRTNTRAPSVNQLQQVINNSNRLALSTGNPDLKQQVNNNIMANFSYANPTNGFNAFLFLTSEYTADYIATKTIYAQDDTLELSQYDVILTPGSQLSYPVNLDHSLNLRGMLTTGYYVKPIQCNITLVTGLGYSQTPGYIDSLLNRANEYNITNSLIITSNINENVDFTVSYTSNYSIVKNSILTQTLDNTEYWYQSANFRFNAIFWKNLVFQTDMAAQYNQGLSENYNQRSLVWNASLGKKFLKNNAAELKFGVYDILNQNNNIKRSVTATAIQDTRTNTFPRYFMFQFTYNLRNFNAPPQMPGHHRPEGFPNRGNIPEGEFQEREMPAGPPLEGPPSGGEPGGFP